jgi:hypothetical protein
LSDLPRSRRPCPRHRRPTGWPPNWRHLSDRLW